MKKLALRIISLCMSGVALMTVFSGCKGNSHKHDFACMVAEEPYLKAKENCQSGAQYYYSCECGVPGKKTFTVGAKTDHDYTAEVVEDKYLKSSGTCSGGAVYYKSCTVCGDVGTATFTHGEPTGGHIFDKQILDEKYLKSPNTCQSAAQYYYSCECGEKGSTIFKSGAKIDHDYTAEVVADDYLKTAGNCMKAAVYYKSCTMCGKKGYESFSAGEITGAHEFVKQNTDFKYLKTDATFETSAVYYKSCVCGEIGEETFTYGNPLKVYTEDEKIPYQPTSLTVSLYDTAKNVYGFTYNTQSKPLRPVIQIEKGNTLTDAKTEYAATVTKATSYDEKDNVITYYIVKAEVALQANETYTYRAYDKYVDVGTAATTLQTKDITATKFTFAHTSDSQTSASDNSGVGSGAYFTKTLSMLTKKSDFIVHTGDVVEWAKYEGYWKAMLNDNFAYLSKIPMMAISGNHETTYRNGTNETFKHFNYNLPTQESTEKGFFYSFVYGNVKFIMLNTNDLTNNQLKSEQYDWLVNELKNNTATWTVVAMHNPMYSIGKYGMDSSKNAACLALRAQLQGLFAQYGVDIVLQGHDHAISRTYPINGTGSAQEETWVTENGVNYSVDPSGVIYVMNGPAGDQSRSPYATDDTIYAYQQSSKKCSWAEFEVDGNKITVTVKYTDGASETVYQTWGIKKTA